MEKKSYLIFGILVLFSLTFISADIEVGTSGNLGVDLNIPTAINYTTKNVNNSIYWNGNLWDESRWVFTTGDTMTGDLNINANLTVDTDVLFVDSLNDKVGIGTDSPGFPFHVDGGSAYNVALFEGNDNMGQGSYLTVRSTAATDANKFAGIKLESGSAAYKGAFVMSLTDTYELNYGIVKGMNFIGFQADTDIGFSTYSTAASARRVAIKIESGTLNVGIGTTTPDSLLEVNGSFKVTNASNDAVILYANQTTGNVGIGTATPGTTAKLNISGSDGSAYFTLDAGGDAYFTLDANTDDAAYVLRNAGDNKFNFGYDLGKDIFKIYNYGTSSEALAVARTTGNIGINTTTPKNTLNVLGTGNFTSGLIVNGFIPAGLALYGYDNSRLEVIAGTPRLILENDGDRYVIDEGGDGFRFYRGGDNVTMRINNLSVQIGDTTEDKSLLIYGNINATGRIISGTLTVTASADDTDVSNANILFINTAGGNVVLGGLTNGVLGQTLNVVYVGDWSNTLTLENVEGINQNFYMHTGADETINGGGLTFVCNGTDWFDSSHAKHV